MTNAISKLNISELNEGTVEAANLVSKVTKKINRWDFVTFVLFFLTMPLPLALTISYVEMNETINAFMDSNPIAFIALFVFISIITVFLIWGEQKLIGNHQLNLVKELVEAEFKLGSFVTFDAGCYEEGGSYIPFLSDLGRINYETEEKAYTFSFKPIKFNRDYRVEAKISKELYDKYNENMTYRRACAGFLNESVTFVDANSELFQNGFEVIKVEKED